MGLRGGNYLIKCENCGHINDENGTFCEKCGANLKSTISSRAFPQEPLKREEGMAKSTKILIVVVIILVAGLGISAGVLMEMSKTGTTAVNNSSVTQSPTQVTNQGSWHEIASFTGSSNGTGIFNTQGNMFKIVMTATPQLNFNTNSMVVDVSDSNDNVVASGDIEWAPTEAISQKEKTIEITDTPGNYSVAETINAIQNWTVDVYDYY